MNEEQLRYELGFALIGFDDEDDGRELFEWHQCFMQPNCRDNVGQPCPCSGVPYLSDEAWKNIKPIIERIMDNE